MRSSLDSLKVRGWFDNKNAFCGTRYSVPMLQFVASNVSGHDLDVSRSREVVGHANIRLVYAWFSIRVV